jgi:MSHA pilin protein MshD
MRDRRNIPALNCRRAGLMLVEAAVCVVIVAVMLVAALQTVGAAAQARQVQVNQCQGPALARQLLAEVRQCRYAEEIPAPTTGAGGAVGMTVMPAALGLDAGEADNKSRALFDDVDDYDGLDDSPPRARDGTGLKGVSDWRRKVSVVYVQPDDPSVVVFDDQGVKRITVTVTGPGGAATTLVALRTRYGGYDQLPRARTTYVTGVNVVLRLGEDGRRIHSGTGLANQVEVPP